MRILPLLAGCLAIVACTTTGSSAQPSEPAPTTEASSSPPFLAPSAAPSPVVASPSTVEFDLSGTAWRAAMLLGKPVDAERPPEIEFDWLGEPSGHGFTGCEEFGFRVTVGTGTMTVADDLIRGPICEGPPADLEHAFLTAFQATEAWRVDGDHLSLEGRRGAIEFTRMLPPVGDPGREIAEILSVGEWQILSAPGVANLELVNLLRFGDRLVIAAGTCGFASDVRFGEGGALDFVEVYWDTSLCAPEDGRPALKRLLDAVSTARPGPDGTVILSGTLGNVVLAPFARWEASNRLC